MAIEPTNIVSGTALHYIDTKFAELESRRGGGSGGDGMEARVAKVEASVEHIQSTLTRIETDLRSLLRFFIGGFVTLAIGLSSVMARGFGWF